MTKNKHADMAIGFAIFAVCCWIAHVIGAAYWLTWIFLASALVESGRALGHAFGSAMRSKASNDNGGSDAPRR